MMTESLDGFDLESCARHSRINHDTGPGISSVEVVDQSHDLNRRIIGLHPQTKSADDTQFGIGHFAKHQRPGKTKEVAQSSDIQQIV